MRPSRLSAGRFASVPGTCRSISHSPGGSTRPPPRTPWPREDSRVRRRDRRPSPAHRDPEAARALGHPDVVAPPTFPTVLTLGPSTRCCADPELGLDYSRVVHGEERYAYAGRSVRGRPAGHRPRSRRSGRWRAMPWSLLRADVATGTASGCLHVRDARVRGAGRAVTALAYDDVEVGDGAAGRDHPGAPRRPGPLRGGLGDFNPIHWSARTATSVGLPDVIAHGMLTMAYAGRAVTGGLETPAPSSSTACASPTRSSSLTTTRGDAVSVRPGHREARRPSGPRGPVRPSGGSKVLGAARASSGWRERGSGPPPRRPAYRGPVASPPCACSPMSPSPR